jgi:hypothetical protein
MLRRFLFLLVYLPPYVRAAAALREGKIVRVVDGKGLDVGGYVNLALVSEGMCWWCRKCAHEQSDVVQVLYEKAEASAYEGRVRFGEARSGRSTANARNG